jgi:hypothetical protein
VRNVGSCLRYGLSRSFNDIKMKINNQNKAFHNLWQALAVIVFLSLLTAGWFAVFPYSTFMGDDLALVTGAFGDYSSSFVKALNLVIVNKYRPVYISFFHIESLLFGHEFRLYLYLNIFLQFLNACLVAFICWHLSRKQVFVALACGTLFIVSRFSYYNVLQVIGGSLEGLALFLFLMLIVMTVFAYEKRNPVYFVWSMLFYFLVSFTHERFLVVGCFLVLAIWLLPVTFKRSLHKFILCIIPILILLFNYALKTVIFKSRFFEGTGGHAIAFDYHQFVLFLRAGFLNLLGFNDGPNYLSGLSVHDAGISGIGLGCLLSFSFLALVITYFRYPSKDTDPLLLSPIRILFLFITLLVPLLATASITIRQEYRWLYAPYTVVIFAVAYLVGRTSVPKWLRSFLIIAIVLSAISVDTFYRRYLNNVFFIDGLRVADSAKANIIDKHKSDIQQKEIFLVGCPKDVKSWYLMGSTFFRFYTDNPEMNVHYVSNLADIEPYRKDMNSFLIFAFDSVTREFKDISSMARGILATSFEFYGVARFDFLKNYEKGKINSFQKVSTPTGAGVLKMDWPSALGIEKTLTVIAGFSYSYDKVSIKQNDFLSFTAGIPFDTSDGALAYIDITAKNGERRRIFQAELAPATKNGIIWESFQVPFKPYAGQEVSITFGTDAIGSPNADWIAFGSPRILSGK